MRRARILLLTGLLCVGILWPGLLHCTPPASAQPPSPSVRVAEPAQGELYIDWRKLPSRPRVWSRPISSAEPRISGDQILVVEPSQRAVSALEPQQGTTRWTLGAPPGVSWSGFLSQVRDLLLLNGFQTDGRPVLSRISSSGKLLWHLVLSEEGLVWPATIGSGLLIQERSRCRQVLVDGESGRRPLPELMVPGYFESDGPLPAGDEPAKRICLLMARLHLGHRGLAILSSDSKRHENGALFAWPRGEDARSRWSVRGGDFRLLSVAQEDGIFFRGYPNVALFRLQLQTGATLWQRDLPETCGDEHRERNVQLVRKAGVATAALIQNCTEAQLVELPAGKVLWTRPTEGALALLAEVDPVDIGYPFPENTDFLPAINRRGARNVRLFSADGRSVEGPKLPADLESLVPVPGGMVLAAHDGAGMLRHSGQRIWHIKGLFRDYFRRSDHFVLLPKESAAAQQVTIEIASGRAFVVAQSSSRPLGRMGAAPGLWLTIVDSPRTLVALDLMEPAK